MRPHSEEARAESSAARRWRPRGKVVGLAALAVLMLATHGRAFSPMVRGLYLCAELVHVGQIHQQLRDDNQALADSIAYLETDEGRKLAARSELEALEAGERALVINKQADVRPPPSPSMAQRLRAWLNRRGERCRQSVDYALAVVKHWLGVAEAWADTDENSKAEDQALAQDY